MMNLSQGEEEGHVFDHEPGMADYHHGYEHVPENIPHHEYYVGSPYPVFLDSSQSDNSAYNNYQANLYRSWPSYSPYVTHDQELHSKQNKKRTFDDFDEFELDNDFSNG